MMKHIFIVFFLMISSAVLACHQVTITETNAVDNGDGTYTYTFDVCMGTEDTYGFFLDFTGPSNIISYTVSVSSGSTGTTIVGSNPPTSGSGDLEYGDWDNNATPLFSGATNDCVSVTVTVDDPITDATIGGTQIDYTSGPCAGTTSDVTSCFASNATYRIQLDLATCNGNPSYFIELDGTLIESGPVDGGTVNYTYCGGCATEFSAGTDKNNCSLNSYSVVDANGSVVASGSGDASNESLGPCALPVQMKELNCYQESNSNIVEWITAAEENSNYFEVQYSADGMNWKSIEKIQAAGNSSEKNYYTVMHRDFNNGINYYRLKQVDYDGKSKYFDIQTVDNKSSEKVVKRVDLMGREIGENFSGIYIEIYEDGSSRKRFY